MAMTPPPPVMPAILPVAPTGPSYCDVRTNAGIPCARPVVKAGDRCIYHKLVRPAGGAYTLAAAREGRGDAVVC